MTDARHVEAPAKIEGAEKTRAAPASYGRDEGQKLITHAKKDRLVMPIFATTGSGPARAKRRQSA